MLVRGCLTGRWILLAFLLSVVFWNSAESQTAGAPDFDALLAAGEFPAALQRAHAAGNPALERQMLQAISARQGMPGGFGSGIPSAIPAASLPPNDVGGGVPPGGGPAGAGGLGGITLSDFGPLMNLIERTIGPDSWSNNGSGDGTMMPFLAGVWVDSSRILHRTEVLPDDRFSDLLDARGELPGKLPDRQSDSSSLHNPTRLLSLVELERAVGERIARGQRVPAGLFYLGGLYDLDAVVVQPAGRDLLISGPAGPWKFGPDGVAVNIATGRPLLRLDDLVTCLRAASVNGGRFGCSITPRKQNLASMQEFLATTRLSGVAWRQALQAAVGDQDIEVFGIDPESHAARILVAADHHMKLLGMGLEPGPTGLQSFFDGTVAGFHGKPIPVDVARWWFTLGDFSVATNPERQAFSLKGQFVRVLSETELINRQGERIHTGRAVGGTARFARDFTDDFDRIADKYPVYRQLEGVFKLAVLAGLIRGRELDRAADWDQGCFAVPARESADHPSRPSYCCAKFTAPVAVQSVMNWKELETRSAGRHFRHTIAGVSGGVECDVAGRLRAAGEEIAESGFPRGLDEELNPSGRPVTGIRDIWKDVR